MMSGSHASKRKNDELEQDEDQHMESPLKPTPVKR